MNKTANRCPSCGRKTRIIQTRVGKITKVLWRQRECVYCEKKWLTEEVFFDPEEEEERLRQVAVKVEKSVSNAITELLRKGK